MRAFDVWVTSKAVNCFFHPGRAS